MEKMYPSVLFGSRSSISKHLKRQCVGVSNAISHAMFNAVSRMRVGHMQNAVPFVAVQGPKVSPFPSVL
jgi:hypothetical protein